jgi:hypothetical protein
MNRSKRPVVSKGAKAELERYFVEKFPIAQVWNCPADIVQGFDGWHKHQAEAIADSIKSSVAADRCAVAVSTKFLNTFMHQLMKYERCRPLWNSLHLPLDRRVFKALAQMQPASLSDVYHLFSRSPYNLSYKDYSDIQTALWDYMAELKQRPGTGLHLTSRIELNWLWI